MELTLLNGRFEQMDQDELLNLSGGADVWDILDKACTIYGTYAFVAAIIPGLMVVGAGSVGAFCAGYKLASWLFG
jgi:hypothetical protein